MVVAVGDTTTDPDAATIPMPRSMVMEVAPWLDHVRVAWSPALIFRGVADNRTVSVAGGVCCVPPQLRLSNDAITQISSMRTLRIGHLLTWVYRDGGLKKGGCRQEGRAWRDWEAERRYI